MAKNTPEHGRQGSTYRRSRWRDRIIHKSAGGEETPEIPRADTNIFGQLKSLFGGLSKDDKKGFDLGIFDNET